MFFKKYKWLLIIVAVIGLAASIWKTVEYIYEQGFKSGVAITTKTFDEKIDIQRQNHQDAIDELRKKNSELSKAVADQVSDIDETYVNNLEKRNEEMQGIIDRINSGDLGLYDNGMSTTSKTGDSSASGTTEASGSCNATEKPRLSKETSRVLVRLTGEADSVTEQLTSCQALVKTYLEVISQYNRSLDLGTPTGSQTTGKQD